MLMRCKGVEASVCILSVVLLWSTLCALVITFPTSLQDPSTVSDETTPSVTSLTNVAEERYSLHPRWGRTELDPLSCWVNTIVAMHEMALNPPKGALEDNNWSFEGYDSVAITIQNLAKPGTKVREKIGFITLQFAIEQMAKLDRFRYLSMWVQKRDAPLLSVTLHPGLGRNITYDGRLHEYPTLSLEASGNSSLVGGRDSLQTRTATNTDAGKPLVNSSLSRNRNGDVVPPDPISAGITFKDKELGKANFYGAIISALLEFALRSSNEARILKPIRRNSHPFKSIITIEEIEPPTFQLQIFRNWHAVWALRFLAVEAANRKIFKEVEIVVAATWVGPGEQKPVGVIKITRPLEAPSNNTGPASY